MELIAARVAPSPMGAGRVRLTGEVSYDGNGGPPEEYWFDVPGEFGESLSRSGNPWLACLLPLAAQLGEPLRLRLPVSRLLLRNARELLSIWRVWYPRLQDVPVSAESSDDVPPTRGPRTAALFSGGVDSFFTALRSTEPNAVAVDDLITVHGFDIPLADSEAHRRRRERIASIARHLGKTAVDVATNLRRTRLQEAEWGAHWHGCGLASVGLALEGRYARVLIPSTHDYATLLSLGSHPLTDPLHSTGRTEVVHDGATHNRFAKLEYVARHEIALMNLHVCYRYGTDRNCGSCEKCVRTMAALDILGRLRPGEAFPGPLDLSRLGRVFFRRMPQTSYYRSLRAAARSRERKDIVRAVDRAMRRWSVLIRLLRLHDWLSERRGLWRAARPLRRFILAESVR